MRALLVLIGFAALTGCVRKHLVPVVEAPSAREATPVTASTPVAAAASTAPARAPVAYPADSATQPVAESQRSTRMPADVRDSLTTLLRKLDDALFDYDKSTIRPDASTVLKDDLVLIRDILAAYPQQKLVIQGFADQRGSEEYNLALGDRRAQSVKDFLAEAGIPQDQLTVVSYGKDRPICTDETEACYQRNRRAHVTAEEQ